MPKSGAFSAAFTHEVARRACLPRQSPLAPGNTCSFLCAKSTVSTKLIVPFTLPLGAQSSLLMMACLSASSKGPRASHSEPSFGEAAEDAPQRTFCTAPRVSRGGGATGAAGTGFSAGRAAPRAEALAAASAAAVLVDGLRHRYSGTAINIAAHTSATTTCA